MPLPWPPDRAAAWSGRLGARRPRGLLPALAVVLGAALALPTALDPGGPAAAVAYLVGTAAVAVCCWSAAAADHGHGRAAWGALALTAACWVTGDLVQRLGRGRGYAQWDVVGPPDLFWVASYATLTAAVVIVIRSRGVSRRVLQAVVLDAVVVTTAAGAVAWQVLIQPGLQDGGSLLALLARSFYPLADVTVFGLALVLLMLPGGRDNPPTVWLVLCLGGTLPLDLLNTLTPLVLPGFDPARLDAGLLLVNALLAAAALHPQRGTIARAVAQDGGGRLQRWRVLLLGGALGALTVTAALRDNGVSAVVPSVVAATVVCSAVVLRFYALVIAQEAAHAETVHRAHHDPLTGAANRALLLHDLTATLATGRRRPAALLFVDLDGFKQVNDTHGHRGGDVVLCAVADRLRRVVREGDCVARLGGDEFVLLCQDVPDTDLPALTRRVLADITGPVLLADGPVGVGASIGALPLPAVGPDAAPQDVEALVEAAMRAADEAMYRAKRAGGGVVTGAGTAVAPVRGAGAP